MAEATFSFDLHVLGTPPALVLSQDQTLQLNVRNRGLIPSFLKTEVDRLSEERRSNMNCVGPVLSASLLSSFQRPDTKL